MSDTSLNAKIKNFAQINNISEDEARKKLEQEEIVEEEQKVEPGSVGEERGEEVEAALVYAGMLSQVALIKTEEYTLDGIKFTVGIQAGGRCSYVEKDGTISFSGSKAVITIIEVTNPEINIDISGINMTLNCDAPVASIKNSGINSIINGSDEADNITSTGIGAIINAGKGDDIIKTSGIKTTIRGGQGDDTITASGIETNVFGNDGDDTINASGINIFADAGSQNDKIKISGINIITVTDSNDNEIGGPDSDETEPNDVKTETINVNKQDDEEDNTTTETIYDENNFDKNGIHKETGTLYDLQGYDKDGYNKDGWHKDGLGYNKFTGTLYDEDGYNIKGINEDGYDRQNRFYVDGVLADGLVDEGKNALMYKAGEKLTGDVEVMTDNTKKLHSYENGKLIAQTISTFENGELVSTISQNFEYGTDGRIYMTELDAQGISKLYIDGNLANETINGVLYIDGIAQAVKTPSEPAISWQPNISNLDPENPQISVEDFFNGKDEIVAEDVIALYNSTKDPVLKELLSYLTDGKDVTPAFKLACAGIAYDSYDTWNNGITNHTDDPDMIAKNGVITLESLEKLTELAKNPSTEAVIAHLEFNRAEGITTPIESTIPAELEQVADLIKNNPDSIFKDLDLSKATDIQIAQEDRVNGDTIITAKINGKTLNVTIKADGTTQIALDVPESPRPNKDMGLDLSQSETYDKNGNLIKSSTYEKFVSGLTNDVVRVDKEITINGDETTVTETRSRNINGVDVQYVTGQTTGDYRHINRMIPVLKIGEMIYDSSVDLLQPKGLSDLYHFVSEHGLQSITHIAETENGYDVTVGGGMTGIEEQTISIGDVLPITPFIPAELEQIANLIKNNPNSIFKDLDLSKATDIIGTNGVVQDEVTGEYHTICVVCTLPDGRTLVCANKKDGTTTITVSDPNNQDMSEQEVYDRNSNLISSSTYQIIKGIDEKIIVHHNKKLVDEKWQLEKTSEVSGFKIKQVYDENDNYSLYINDTSICSSLMNQIIPAIEEIIAVEETDSTIKISTLNRRSFVYDKETKILSMSLLIPAELEQVADLIKNNPDSIFKDLDLSKATVIGITKEMKKIGSEETILISDDFIPVGYEETGAKIINAKIGDSELTITIKADGTIGIEQITNSVVLGQNRPEDYPKTETYDKDGNLIASSYYEVIPDESGAGEPIKVEKTFTETDTTKTTTTTKTRTEWNSLYTILPTNGITPFSQIIADIDIVKTPIDNKINIQVVTEEVLDKTTGKVTTSEKFLINGVEIEAPQGFDLTKITKVDVSDNEYIFTIKDAPRDMAGKLVAFDKVSGKQVEPNYVNPELQAIIENSKWKDYGLDLTNAIFTQIQTVPQGMVGGGENVRAWTLANGDVIYLTNSYSGLTSSSSTKLVQQRNINGVNIEFESSVHNTHKNNIRIIDPQLFADTAEMESVNYSYLAPTLTLYSIPSLTIDGVKINPEYGNNEELLAMVEKYGADAITSAKVLENGTIEVELKTNDEVQKLVFHTTEEPVFVSSYNFTIGAKTQKILINGQEVSVSVSIKNASDSIKLKVDKEGIIHIENNGASSIDFSSAKVGLKIVVDKSTTELSLTGTAYDDEITIKEGVNISKIHSDKGNDKITNMGEVSVEIDAGSGDDTIINKGNAATITGNTGDDTISNEANASAAKITGYTGNDNIINKGTISELYGSTGDDVITNEANATITKLDTGDNNDVITNEGSIGTINAGKGMNVINGVYYNGNTVANGFIGKTLYVDGVKSTAENFLVFKNIKYQNGQKLNGKDDKGIMYKDGVIAHNMLIDTKYYVNGIEVNTQEEAIMYTFTPSLKTQKIFVHEEEIEVSVSTTKNAVVNVTIMPDGTIIVDNQGATAINFAKSTKGLKINVEKSDTNIKITGTNFNDTITVENGAKISSIDAGKGDDTIVNHSVDNPNATIIGGAGNDTITNYGQVKSIDGGAGNDSISNIGTVGTITGGAGNDTISNKGTVTKQIDAGSGDNTISH